MFRIASLTLSLGLLAGPALAHPGHAGDGFLAGFSHPLFGLDHVIAMVAVGLWAATLGRAALLALPAAFVGAMVAGFGLALAGVALPLVEPMILASVILSGVVIALAIKADLRIAAGTVALFGLFHGFAHGAETGTAGALAFAPGFVLATVLLHAAGAGLGLWLGRSRIAAGIIGAGAAMMGLVLALA